MEQLINQRRRIAAALSLTGLLALGPQPDAEAATSVPRKVCKYDWREGRRQVKRLIRCAAKRWRVPGGPDKAIRVARCESGFDPSAYGNGNAGVYQQRLIYWPERAKRFGFPGWSAYNGRANVIVSIRMAHRDGWGAWSCG